MPPAGTALSEMAARIESYLEGLLARGYSAETVQTRRVHLGKLAAWLSERGIERPAEVTKPVLDRYQRFLYHYRKADGAPLSFRGQHGRLVPVRGFFKWLARQNLILYNPASELELPRLERRLPKAVLSAAEAEAVLAVVFEADPFAVTGQKRSARLAAGTAEAAAGPLRLRDRAILELLYATGMRRGELVRLTVYDLDGERGTVAVRQGKGKKDRLLPLGERAAAWLERYVREARPRLAAAPDPGTLFLTNAGEPFTKDFLTQLVRRYVEASGVGKPGACHLFRHTMATLMLEGGADIRFIQQMLGHADLNTTQIYTQVSIRKLQAIHAATHPGARLRRTRTGDGSPETEEKAPLPSTPGPRQPSPGSAGLFSLLAAEAAGEDGEET